MLRAVASLALAVALGISLVCGGWSAPPVRNKRVSVEPPRNVKPPVVRKHQAVSASALRRGCAAWGEDLATCVVPGEDGDAWSGRAVQRR